MLESQISFYFLFENRASKERLFYAVKGYVDHLESTLDKYVGDFDNALLGNNIDLKGHGNFIRTSNIKVRGSDSYVMDNRSGKTAHGDHLMLVGSYRINLDRLEEIRVNPRNVITKVQHT